MPRTSRWLLLSLCGVGGMSCLLALMADVLSLSTLHICLFYRSMGAAYAHMLRVLHSLALLFQGQKWNTLRSRADTCEFELDQLLLGTLLFAVHFFLFPNDCDRRRGRGRSPRCPVREREIGRRAAHCQV